MTQTVLLGLILALAASLAAWRAGALAPSGACAATITGAIAFTAGLDWALLLIAFFVSSTGLSRVRAPIRARRLDGHVAKAGARDAAQVLSNGGAFLFAALAWLFSADPAWQLAGAAALAASAADTWATELGTLASAAPRSIVTGRVVDVGTSGGVTLQGFAAALAGAAFIGLLTVAMGWTWVAAVAAVAGGLTGCVIDSLLGATVQVKRWCAVCGMATEQQTHRCGTPTAVIGGWHRLDNDGVNAVSSTVGALFGAGVASLVRLFGHG